MYFNDETPDGNSNSTAAHQKGVLAVDPASGVGFYLLHSTPGWPNVPSKSQKYDSDTYGQHFFCVTVDIDEIDKIADNLYTTRPQIYYNGFDADWVKTNIPTLYKVINGEYKSDATKKSVTLTSHAGHSFTMFYKNTNAHVDMWTWIAESLKHDLYVETWLRDASANPSCGTYSVEMVG